MCCIRVKYCCINFVIAPNVLDAQDIPILELNSDFPDLTNLCVDFMYTLLVFLFVCLFVFFCCCFLGGGEVLVHTEIAFITNVTIAHF